MSGQLRTENQVPVRIGGNEVVTSESIAVESPFDGRLLACVPRCGRLEVNAAVAAARTRLAESLPAWRRAEILEEAVLTIGRHADELAMTIAAEAAKPIRSARAEVERAALTFRFAAVEARTLVGDMIPMEAAQPGEGKLGFTLRVPKGVIAAISPFNFPLNLVAHKVAPAIAAGCPVVLKPATRTPLSAIRLVELLLDECGLPPGWVSVVTGSGSDVGDALTHHEDVAMVTFTGSPDVGYGIRQRSPRKDVALELGNNAPVIIEATADWRKAAAAIRIGGYSHAGQSCISTQRVLVHESIAERFLEELLSQVEGITVGDPLLETTEMSALIAPTEAERVSAWIEEACRGGAIVETGGNLNGRILSPTVLSSVTGEMRVSCEEVFGPVVSVTSYDTLDEALRIANDTRYGLQAAIFTGELSSALAAAYSLDFGGVLVNEIPTFRTDQMPYGGHGLSGNTKEGPHHSVREMTRERLVVLHL
jgi:acyl-CoA reductase-like NAD-dependent aldehyde dehydrogenase